MKKILLLSSLLTISTLYTLSCFAELQESYENPAQEPYAHPIINEDLEKTTEAALAPYLDQPFICGLNDNFSIVLEFKSGTYGQFYMNNEDTSELKFYHSILLVTQLSYNTEEEGAKVVFERTYQIALPTEVDDLLNAETLHQYIQQAFTTVVKLFTSEYLELVQEYQQNIESTVEATNVPQE